MKVSLTAWLFYPLLLEGLGLGLVLKNFYGELLLSLSLFQSVFQEISSGEVENLQGDKLP